MDPRLPIWPVVAGGVAFGALIAAESRAVRGMPLAPAVAIDAIAGSAHVAGFGLPSRAAAVTR